MKDLESKYEVTNEEHKSWLLQLDVSQHGAASIRCHHKGTQKLAASVRCHQRASQKLATSVR